MKKFRPNPIIIGMMGVALLCASCSKTESVDVSARGLDDNAAKELLFSKLIAVDDQFAFDVTLEEALALGISQKVYDEGIANIGTTNAEIREKIAAGELVGLATPDAAFPPLTRPFGQPDGFVWSCNLSRNTWSASGAGTSTSFNSVCPGVQAFGMNLGDYWSCTCNISYNTNPPIPGIGGGWNNGQTGSTNVNMYGYGNSSYWQANFFPQPSPKPYPPYYTDYHWFFGVTANTLPTTYNASLAVGVWEY